LLVEKDPAQRPFCRLPVTKGKGPARPEPTHVH
jgi:hypothetical protein